MKLNFFFKYLLFIFFIPTIHPSIAEQVSSNCNNQVAIVLAPTRESWTEALNIIPNNSKLKLAIKANKGWGAKTSEIPVHMTLTSYSPPSNSSCSYKHGSTTKTTVGNLNKTIAANGSNYYHLGRESWNNPIEKGELTIFSIKGNHKTLENIFKILQAGKFDNPKKSVGSVHVSFVRSQSFSENTETMKEFLGKLRWTAIKMCAEKNKGLEVTARACD